MNIIRAYSAGPIVGGSQEISQVFKSLWQTSFNNFGSGELFIFVYLKNK